MEKGIRFVTLSLFLVLLASCVPPPPATPIVIENTRNYTATYDKVWGSLVEFFAITNLSIATIEKESGIIGTSTFAVAARATECDCPSMFLWTRHWANGRFNVFVSEQEGVVNVRVTTSFTATYSFDNSYFTKPCTSTGQYEVLILDYIDAKVSNQPLPTTPMFTPGRNN